MERVDGVKVTDHRLQDAHQKRRLARRIVRALLAEPLFSVAERPLFHGDPHAGNLFLARDGRVAILDWSLAGRLGARERIAVVQMVLAALTLDDRRLALVLTQLSVRQQPDPSALQQVAREWIRRVRKGTFPGMSWLVGMLDDAVKRAGVQVCAELMLFRKTLLVLEGVCAEVGESEGLISRTLMVEFLKHFAIEWPSRWIRSPTSRRFSTRLSSVDLASTVLNAPAALSRFWSEQTIELAERCLAKWEQALQPGSSKTV
jgi:ubiquinone biosynthesis protein